MDCSAAVQQTASAILDGDARRATKYIAPNLVVKATRRHRPNRRARTVEMVVTVGRPNYAEREFIKQAAKAGEPFPIKRMLLKPWKE